MYYQDHRIGDANRFRSGGPTQIWMNQRQTLNEVSTNFI